MPSYFEDAATLAVPPKETQTLADLSGRDIGKTIFTDPYCGRLLRVEHLEGGWSITLDIGDGLTITGNRDTPFSYVGEA